MYFSSTAVHPGTSPLYEWYVNNTYVNSGSDYSSKNLTNGDSVRVKLTPSVICAQPSIVWSSAILMSVGSTVTPTVTISPLSSNICSGDTVVYTASATNEGSSPSYQWKFNGLNVGSNASSYSVSGLTNSDSVEVVLTSSATCVLNSSVTSAKAGITVTPSVTPSVLISSSDTTICAGTNVSFTASSTNGGSNPTYVWYLNGNSTGTIGTTYSSASLAQQPVKVPPFTTVNTLTKWCRA